MSYIGKKVYIENTKEHINTALLSAVHEAFKDKFYGDQEISSRAVIEEKIYLLGEVVAVKDTSTNYNKSCMLLVKLAEGGHLMTVNSENAFFVETEKENKDAAREE